MVEIKICGLSTPEAIEAAIAAGADFIGFVHFAKSPRHVSLEQAAQLVRLVGGRAKTVLLLVNPDDELVETAAKLVPFDLLQLHGDESPARVAEIKAIAGRPVVKAVKVANRADIEASAVYDGLVAFLLFDAKPPTASQLPGGNGIPFDWTLLSGFNTRGSYMLSGGLDAENVVAAVQATGATMIDVSSGVEKAPGVKDIEKIKKFVARVRAAAAPAMSGEG